MPPGPNAERWSPADVNCWSRGFKCPTLSRWGSKKEHDQVVKMDFKQVNNKFKKSKSVVLLKWWGFSQPQNHHKNKGTWYWYHVHWFNQSQNSTQIRIVWFFHVLYHFTSVAAEVYSVMENRPNIQEDQWSLNQSSTKGRNHRRCSLQLSRWFKIFLPHTLWHGQTSRFLCSWRGSSRGHWG